MRIEVKVSGIVQGVGFRPFVYRTAVNNNLTGYVRNRGDAYVEIVIEGNKINIDRFLRDLKDKKPPLAEIHDISIKHMQERNQFARFTIERSSTQSELSGSVIPPDISICPQCLHEMRDPENRRHDYFFITCTDCGPRYTIIENLPYDRLNTTMKEFSVCPYCKEEYMNPTDRRFHAQTVACPECGPQVLLATNTGQPMNSKDPIREAGKLLEGGSILAVKGYGGFHVAASTTKDEPITRLRTAKHRSQKPFAIMARDLQTAKTFVEIDQKEAALLTSHIKPILLLRKSSNYYLSDLVAPGLHNIGVMLPYTGLHHMLFDNVQEPAFIMTSANPPNEPIVTENSEAARKFGNLVDYFLFHNRSIAHRCDDSVVRLHDGRDISLIRRSRGYAPEPIKLKWSFDNSVLGVGAELNSTSCILHEDNAFMSQHVGDVENLETLQFHKSTINHLLRLTNIKAEAVSCDLHPKFTTTLLARDLQKEFNFSLFKIQHHHAHAAALMAEYGVDELIAIACDGYGYGSDGKAWGGEVLLCRNDGSFQRMGHLEEQPLIGGDLATRYPLRMTAGILTKTEESGVDEWLLSNVISLPRGKEEVKVIMQQLKKPMLSVTTTSCGRVLDAVSALLGICSERTYEGEPAMKLEAVASDGKDVLKLKPLIKNDILNTTALLREIFINRQTIPRTDLAFSAQTYLASGLAQIAVEGAEKLGINAIGFTGGVAHNEHMTLTMRKRVEESGLKFIVHESVPPSDGGISLGQAVAAAWQMK